MTDTLSAHMFDVEFQSGPLAVRQALAQVLDGLKPLSLDVEETGTIELVLAEALNNIVEHAYPEGDPTGAINITCKRGEKGLHFRVTDSGRPMPEEKLPMAVQADVDVDMFDLPEGGFGWFLIQDLAKDVDYAYENGKNILDLRLAVAMGA